MIAIRQAEDRDVETLSILLCASIRELCTADHNDDPELIARWTADKTPEHVAAWIANPRNTLFVAERDGQPACVGCINAGGQVLLNYVAPAHRFRGVSAAMLAHLEAVLADRNIDTARLTSTKTAHRFDRDAGWADVGESETVFGITGYPMEKKLRPAGDMSGEA